MKDLIKLGSKTAKNEFDVVDRFNNWQNDKLAKDWIKAMNYNLNEIEYVRTRKIKGTFKADIQVQINIEIKLKKILDVQNLQVKLILNPAGG